jgi:hypothetical protein
VILFAVFVIMAIPLGFSLSRIAREALIVSQVRSYLGDTFGAQSRVTQLDVDSNRDPIAVRSVVIARRSHAVASGELRAGLSQALGRSLTLQVDAACRTAGSRRQRAPAPPAPNWPKRSPS